MQKHRMLTSTDHVDTAVIHGRYAIYGVCKCTEATLGDRMLRICAYWPVLTTLTHLLSMGDMQYMECVSVQRPR